MTRCIRSLAQIVVLLIVAGETRAQAPASRVIALAAPNATLPVEFNRIGSVRELSDGRTIVSDGGDKRILIGDWLKGTVAQIGRIGSGPGEYATAGRLFALTGDSTLLPDAGNGRWVLFHRAAIVATVPSDAPPIVNGGRSPLGADERGTVIFTRARGAGTTSLVGNKGPDSTLLVRMARADGRADTVAVLRARPSTISVQGPSNKPTAVSIAMNPLATGELAALFPDGWIAIARLDPYRIEWIARDGKHSRGAALPFEAVRLDEREIRAYLQRLADNSGTEPKDPASYPDWPEIMPPFQAAPTSVLTGPGGMLWVRRPVTAAQNNTIYDVVDRRGGLVARVNAGEASVVGFGGGVVYTIMTDDNGIQRLQRRPLPKW